MCELLGLNFNQPVRCSLSFRGFRHRGEDNLHGWGVARFDGFQLYCYRDRNGYNGLCMTERTAPFGRVSPRDEDWEIEFAEEKRPDQRGIVIAIRPLTNEKWDGLVPGSLYVFKKGQCVYGPDNPCI